MPAERAPFQQSGTPEPPDFVNDTVLHEKLPSGETLQLA